MWVSLRVLNCLYKLQLYIYNVVYTCVYIAQGVGLTSTSLARTHFIQKWSSTHSQTHAHLITLQSRMYCVLITQGYRSAWQLRPPFTSTWALEHYTVNIRIYDILSDHIAKLIQLYKKFVSSLTVFLVRLVKTRSQIQN